jgi:uncharacterized protein
LNNQLNDQSMNTGAAPPPAHQTSEQPPSTLHNIFIGPDGLRAGWSLLIFIALYAAIAFTAITIAHTLHHPPPKATKGETISLTSTFLGDSIPLAIALLVTWIMSRIERRPFSVYGLGGQRKLPNLLTGIAWGVIFLSLLVFILWRSGFLIIDGRGLFGSDIVRYSAAWLAAFLLIAITEEFVFRGYIQYTLTRGLAGLYRWAFKTRHSAALGFWSSAVIWAILFGFVHKGNPGESPIGLVCASLAALLFCFSLWRTGSLWWGGPLAFIPPGTTLSPSSTVSATAAYSCVSISSSPTRQGAFC